jgi:two-component system chemotaxis response regulator CheY
MNPRILVVDDAATVRMYNRSILEGAGFAVEEAINGVEALEKSLRTPFDLYLVDINMPKLDGYGFLRALRQEDVPQAPAVMISTEAETKDRALAWVAGANYYLVKPIKPQNLVAVCRLLINAEGEA